MPIELKIPQVGESITEVEIGPWLKQPGELVQKDEPVVTLESEKATVELPAPESGTLAKVLKQKGDVAKVGEVIGFLEAAMAQPEAGERATQAATAAQTGRNQGKEPRPQKQPDTQSGERRAEAPPGANKGGEPRIMPAAERLMAEHGLNPEQMRPTGAGGRLLKEDVLRELEKPKAGQSAPQTQPGSETQFLSAKDVVTEREEEIVPMSRLRRTVAERLVEAQRTAALLTTFNEADMTQVLALRKEFGDAFAKKYEVKLGFMSFFVKASIDALKQFPEVNAEVRGTNIVYRNYFDIGVAIGGGKGLVVPVLRHAERMSFAEIELAIGDFARRARENKLKIEELQGGTFTISNGGVYGSLLSTPIVNPPQSGVLGMHAIQERPVAREGSVVIRPMMYLALTYDHRIVDGREGVTFLRRIKEAIENPTRMLMEI